MKPRQFAAAAAAILAAASALAAPAAAKVLTMTVESRIDAAPDVADIGAGVMTQATEASAALSANAAAMTRVVAALKKNGVADRDIQTSALSVQPQYRYAENRAPELIGFQASNRVQVRLRDVRNAGRIIDTLVREGANQIDGPTFAIDKPEPLLDKARAEAVRIGRARAELYAAAAGMRVASIIAITEAGAQQPPPIPVPRMAMAREAAADSSPVASGEVSLGATLVMTFALE